jgi:hypothetical protein
VTNIQWRAATGAGDQIITGSGRYQIGGEVAIQHQLTLDLVIDSKPVTFTNDTPRPDKTFPLLSVSATETTPTLLQVLSLNLVAAPAREIWFSTRSGFTPASGAPHGSGGDVLSSEGRIVKSASSLVAAFELSTGGNEPQLQLDALDLRAGGEVLFSLAEDHPASRVGPLHHGDLLSDQGRIVKRNQELTGIFGPDAGLDAVMALPDGKFLFSITTNIFSERLGRIVRRGDLLSSDGSMVASNSQLLARFHPATTGDVGLDAVFVWPNGEIWFSTEESFQDRDLGTIGAGDLISDQGIIVYRNLELMSRFAPVEDLADFGLDALFVVTDLNTASTGPRLTQIQHSGGKTHLEWDGLGRVFQVMRSSRVEGPYDPVSPILPALSFDDETDAKLGFYRIQQW